MPHREVYKGIAQLFSEPETTFSHFQAFEAEVLQRELTGVSRNNAVEQVLTEWETRFGHPEAFTVTPEEGALSQSEWFERLRTGGLPRDLVFTPGSFHGIQTHRIQWNVVLREAARNPQRFGATSVDQLNMPDVVRTMGSEEVHKNLTIEESDDLWTILFDSFADSMASPEATRAIFQDYISFEWE